MNSMRSVPRLSQLAAALTVLFLALLALEHAIVPSLDPIEHMISEYANAGGFAGATGMIALLVWGFSFLSAAGAAARARGRDPLGRALVGCLTLAGVGLAVAAVFPTQAVRGVVPAGVELEFTGRMHDLGGGAAQLAIFAAALLGTRVVAGQRFRAATIVVLVLATVLGLSLTALDPGARGLRQRALVVAACCWQLAFLAGLATARSGRTTDMPSVG